MSRSQKKQKPPGFEYWSRRPMSRNHGATPGRVTKKITHKRERGEAKKEMRKGDT